MCKGLVSSPSRGGQGKALREWARLSNGRKRAGEGRDWRAASGLQARDTPGKTSVVASVEPGTVESRGSSGNSAVTSAGSQKTRNRRSSFTEDVMEKVWPRLLLQKKGSWNRRGGGLNCGQKPGRARRG